MPNRGLTGNQLKIIAAISMLLDHVGLLLLPQVRFLRVLGRLAFPIFAYMIAEGCRYTRNKWRYFAGMFGLGLLCQVVYFLFDGSLYMCILITFSLSIPVIYALQLLKRTRKPLAGLLLAVSIGAVYILNQFLDIDYGFWGSMVPVFASLFQQPGREDATVPPHLDRLPVHLCALALGLCILAMSMAGYIQYFSLLALPILLCYSGKRGKANMKYFFYLFYPFHLAALQGIYMLIGN